MMIIEAGAPFTLAAAKFGGRQAIRAGGETLTYDALGDAANRLGSGLSMRGVAQGDRVGVLSHNRIEVPEIWLGLERFNIVRFVMHSHFDMAVHVRTLNDLGATVLIFDSRFTAEVENHRGSMSTVKHFIAIGEDAPDWALRYDHILNGGNTDHPHIDVEENDPCFIQLTTGTTGFPKPWIATHRSWRAVVANNLEHLDTFGGGIPALAPNDVNLHFHALQWATGFQTFMPYMLRGARSIILDDAEFDPERIVDAIVGDGVTGFLVPAPMLPSIMDAYEKREGATHAIRRMVIFFATPDLLERATEVFGHVWCHGFGSTEQGAPTTRLTCEEAEESPKRLSSVGRNASPFFEMAIMNENAERLPAGTVGEIVVRSEMSASAYWQLDEKTTEAFFPGDWFRSGDIGYIDDDGFLYYLDRAKDRIRTANGVVYPHVIETALLQHRAVANCGVVGLGDVGGQAVVAGVLLHDGVSKSSDLAEDILAMTGAALSDNERPSKLVFLNELPTVLGGAKVKREELQAQIAALGREA